MGLDMYLSAKLFASDYGNKTAFEKLRDLDLGAPRPPQAGGSLPYVELRIPVVCWRKANHIHKWFVDNAQRGVDDCRAYPVERQQLEVLRDLCKQVLDDHSRAEDILPAQSGFFFGGTDYDEWYFEKTQDTADELTTLLAFEDPDYNWSFEYQSSW